MEENLAIVTNGGGMNCSYSAGVLCGLAQIYNIREPKIIVGSSGSTGALAYYVSEQYLSIENIWTNLIATKKFISFKRINKIMDLDYLIDDIFKHLEPLKVNSINESKTKLFISATEYSTGEAKFFTNQADIFQVLKASKTVPLITNKKVIIDGIEYIDGTISSPFSINIEKAIKEGARDIILIKDVQGPSILIKIFLYSYSFFVNKKLKEVIRNYCKRSTHIINSHNGVNIFIIRPSRKLKTNPLDINKGHLKDSFNLGYNDAKNNETIKKFILNTSL